MKKHLIAAAVAAAVAVPAAAQVTISGRIDMNVNVIDSGANSSETVMDDGALSSSRLTFRGSEDLGGGLKAEFMLEGRLTPETGQINSNGAIFNRESWVGISGGFGAIRAGVSDVSDAANIDTTVSQAGNLGGVDHLSGDKTKVIRYTTPNFNGFQVQVGYANPSGTSSSEVTTDRNTDLYAQYVSGPLGVYVGQQSVKKSSSYDQKHTGFGVKYDFGTASAGLYLADVDNATSGSAGRDLMVVSVAVPIGAGLKIHGVYETDDTDGTAANTDFTEMKLALTKALSKRTTVYAAYTDKDFDVTSVTDTNQLTLGVLHTF